MADDNILDVPKSDVASDPSYDNDPVGQADLTEDIKRKQLGRQMTGYLAYGLGILTLIFFALAFCKAFSYLEVYKNALTSSTINKDNFIPYLIPFVPYTLMVTLGLVCLITLARLVSTYTNNNNSDDTELLSKLVNAISNIFRGKSD